MKIADELVAGIDELVSQLDEISNGKRTTEVGGSVHDRLGLWRGRVVEWLKLNLGEEAIYGFTQKRTGTWGDPTGTVAERYAVWRPYLMSLQLDISENPSRYQQKHERAVARAKRPNASRPLDDLEAMLRRFHAVAIQLRRRHADRATLDISDEYDVQDLLHAILRCRFDDVRAEEVTPSYAGGGSRVDFLLKAEQVGIEVKHASARLRDKAVGEQLIVDIARYQVHGDIRTLVCFVYDPQGYLTNPGGLVADLSKTHGNIEVRVIISGAA